MRLVKVTAASQLVDLGDGVHAYDRFEVHEEDRLLPYRAEVVVAFDGDRYICEALRCMRREGGPPVTAERVRQIPIAGLVRWGAEQCLLTAQETADGKRQLSDPLTGITQRIKVGRRPTDDVLAGVAALYRLAYALGRPPTKYVSEALVVPKPTVARWVGKARERGFLGPAEPGKAGEKREGE